MRRFGAVLLLVLLAFQAHAQSRTYFGTFSSRWKTQGLHGHDQPWCAEPKVTHFPNGGILHEGQPCEPDDFARANLDNSIGFRGGRERDLRAWGPLRLIGGLEGSLSHTEYNLTQRDFTFIRGAVVAGADFAFRDARVGVRYGAGPFVTTTGVGGVHSFREVSLTVPVRPGASIRIARRLARENGPGDDDTELLNYPGIRPITEAVETSLLYVATPGSNATSPWEFGATSGVSIPGPLGKSDIMGKSLGLHSAHFQRLSASRDLRRFPGTQLELAWTSSGHESNHLTHYRGFDGNQRGKTINGYGIAIRRSLPFTNRMSIRYGGGIEVADWRDDHNLLLEGERVVPGGIEGALSAHAALRLNLGNGMALETSLDHLRWRNIGLGELRTGFTLVITR